MTTSILQPGIQLRHLHSPILNQELQLTVKLPWSYERSHLTYPVLFSLDGNRSFPLYSTQSLIYETPRFDRQEVLIVGVGYKVDSDRYQGLAQWAAWRTRDFTPEPSPETEQWWKQRLSTLIEGADIEIHSGGAGQFLQVLQEEVIPFIEANYRASPTDRGLGGFSDGGLFTLYALFHAPETFQRFFAGSPSMWNQLFKYEENYAATHEDLPARLFITAGDQEADLLEPIQRMLERLQSRGYPGLDAQFHIFKDENHMSVYAASVSRALRVLYPGNR